MSLTYWLQNWKKNLLGLQRGVPRAAIRKRSAVPQVLETLEDRVLLAATSFNAGTLTIDFSTVGEAVTVTNNGTNITISSTGSVTGDGTSFATGSITRLVVTDSGSLAGQSLTMSGSANYVLSGGLDVTGAENATLNRAISTAAANLSVTTSESIVVNGALSATDGDILLSANQQTTAASGNFYGIYVNNASVATTGTGSVTLLGRGSFAGTGGNYGLYLVGATVSGKSTTVTGTGGNNAGGSNFGVWLSSTTITSTGGNVEVTGTGGDGDTGGNAGVAVASNSTITATGAGTVLVTGTGGGTGLINAGVALFAATASITSAGGDVTVIGTGGFGVSSVGVSLTSGTISAGGNGNVNVTGIATSAAGSSPGVSLSNTNPTITSGGGKVTVTASANGSVALSMTNSSITSGSNADIEIVTNSINLGTGASVNSGSGQTTITPYTAGTRVNLGGGDVLTGSPLTLGFDDSELDRITAGTLVIGDINAGNITVSTAVSPTSVSQLELVTGAQIIDGNSTGTDITVTRLGLTASTGIGVGNALDTAVSNLEATTATGGIFISNTGALTIGDVNGTLSGVNVTGASGGIQLDAAGSLRVFEPVIAPGSITFNATGTTSDVTVDAGIGGVRSSSGDMTVTAGRDLILGFNGQAGDVKSVSNLTSLSAGHDIVITDSSFAQGGSISATAANDFTVSNTALFNATGGNGTATVVSGGTLTIDSSDGGSGRRGIATNNGAITLTTDSLVVGALGDINAGFADITVKTATDGTVISLGSTGGGLRIDDAAFNAFATTGVITIGRQETGGGANNSGNITFTSPINLADNAIPTGTLQLLTGGAVIDATTAGQTAVTVAGLAVSAGGLIGASGTPLKFAATTLTTDTSLTNAAQYLSEADSVTIGAADLKAGSGTITFNSGTFLLAADQDIASNLVVASGATLGGTGTVTGNVSGAGNVSPGNSPGAITINGNFTPTGTVTFEVNPPAEIAGTDYDQIIVSGTVDLSGATLVITGATGAVSTNQIVTLIQNTSVNQIIPSATYADGAVVTINGNSYRLFYNGGAGDNNLVLVENSAPATVYVDDSFTGNVGQTIDDADLGTTGDQPAVFGINAFTTIAEALAAVSSSGTVIINAGTYAETVSVSSTQTLVIGGADTAQAVTFSSLATVSGTTLNLAGTSSLTIGDATDTVIAGTITGGGSLTKQGAGIVTVSGDNTYSGTTSVSAGTLQVTANNGLGTTAGGTTVASGATLDLRNVNYSTAEGVTLAGGTLANSSGTTTFAGAVTMTASSNFTTTSSVFDLQGAILGGFAFQKNGAGTMRLSNTGNTFASVIIAGGTLQLGASDVIPDTADISNSSSFDLNGFDETLDAVSGNGSIVNSSPSIVKATLTVGAGNNSGDSRFNGPISGGINLVKTGTGRQTLGSGSSSYTGTTTINNGTLAVTTENSGTAARALGSVNGRTIVNSGGILEFVNVAYDLAEPITVNGGTIRASAIGGNPAAGASTFGGPITLSTGTAAFDLTTAATLTLNGIIDGDQALTKTGVGTLVLATDNSYSGNTTVNAGTLIVNGSLASSSAVAVNNAGTLGGSGTVNGTVNVASGGTVSPGNSPGVLSTGNVTFQSGSTFVVELNGATTGTFDQLNVTGTVFLYNGTLTVSGTITSNIGQQIVILNNDDDDGLAGTFNNLPEGAVLDLNGLAFQITYQGGTDGNDVVLTEVLPPNDVSVTVTDNMAVPVAGGTITYTITVTNTGSFAANATSLIDNIPVAITSTSWTSSAAGGATGNTASGSGNLAETLFLPAGASVTYMVTANISSSATGSLNYTATVSQAGDTNSDNDSATDTDLLDSHVAITKINDASEPSTNGKFRVTQAVATEHDTIVTYSISGTALNGIDYATLTGSVTIPAGSTSADIDVLVLNDLIVEAGETIEVTLTGFTQADPGVILDPTPSNLTATVNLSDDDVATISIARVTDGAESNSPTNGKFRITQSAVSSTDTVVNYSISGSATPGAGNDYSTLTGTVTIPAGQTAVDVDVTVLIDNLVEGNETVIVTLTTLGAHDLEVTISTLPADQTATVTITDDDKPVFIGDSSVNVAENTLTSTVVLDVNVDDSLIAAGHSVTYSLSGPDAGLFNINSATGQITFITSPDFEAPADELADNVYHVTVTATADTDPTQATSRDLTITVTPVNDFTPVFADASPTFAVPENSAVNTVVGTVAATDADLPTQGLTYSIVSGNDSGAFAINPTTGEITVADSTLLDYETTPSFTLTVRVSDNTPMARTADAVVEVNLTNVNEAPQITIPNPTGTYHLTKLPAFVSPDSSFAYPDNATPNYAGATLTLSIVAGRSKRDKLTIFSKGTDAGQIHIKGKKVFFGSTQIGTFTGGKGAKPDLVVTFNSNATNAAVDNLLRRLNFQAKTDVGTNRTVQIQVTNIEGVDSNVATRDIAVVARV